MKTKGILLDISIGAVGYSGMPQDVKWLLKTLTSLPDYKVSCLLYDLRPNSKTLNFDMQYGLTDHPLTMASYLGLLNDEPGTDLSREVLSDTSKASLIKIPKMFHNTIWRTYLQAGLTGKDKKYLEDNGVDYYTSKLQQYSAYWKLRQWYEKISQQEIDTTGFDYVVFEDSKPFRVSDGTKKIIRYHDPLPITCSDMFNDPVGTAENHYLSIRENERQGAYYVCNSEWTRNQLVQLFPGLAGRSSVVNYALSEIYFSSIESNKDIVRSIINIRQSEDTRSVTTLDEKDFNSDTQYLLAVATIEPRKNYHALINAYALLSHKYPNLKLIICGANGWKNRGIMSKMRVLASQKKLFYLPNLHPTELYHMYKNASVFVSLSFDEGFGLPPVEAQALGVQVVSSDIPPHREGQRDGSIFVDPYDVDDIVEGIKTAMSLGINTKGIFNSRRYQQPLIRQEWDRVLTLA